MAIGRCLMYWASLKKVFVHFVFLDLSHCIWASSSIGEQPKQSASRTKLCDWRAWLPADEAEPTTENTCSALTTS